MKKLVFTFLLILIALLGCAAAAEIFLRAQGYKPHRSKKLPLTEHQKMYEPDPVLGWRLKSGIYVITRKARTAEKETYTIRSDESRAVSPRDPGGPYDLVFIGCSYTFGEYLSDHETYPWKLQELHPGRKTGNFAVSAYSTYQSLLRLEDLYRQGEKPSIVVYGFFEYHELRNTAACIWRKQLARASVRHHPAVPHCALDEKGGVIRKDPVSYPDIPFRDKFVLGPFLWEAIVSSSDEEKERYRDARAVTKELIKEMDRLTKMNGGILYVAFLAQSEAVKKAYIDFLSAENIRFIDPEMTLTEKWMVPKTNHPGPEAAEIWAKKTSETLIKDGLFTSAQ